MGNHEADQPCSLSNFQKEKTEKEKWVFEETVAENFPNLIKDMNMNIQEAEQAPNKMYLKEMHHNQTWSFNKERILKASSKKWIVTYKSHISQGVNIQNIWRSLKLNKNKRKQTFRLKNGQRSLKDVSTNSQYPHENMFHTANHHGNTNQNYNEVRPHTH